MFGASVVILLGGGYLHGTLVDLGLLAPPYLVSITFIFLVLFMSMILAGDAARSAELNREVVASERRWRYPVSEIVGRTFLDFIPGEDREELKQRFERAMTGEVVAKGQSPFLTRGGKVRQIVWSRVLLRDGSGHATGTLSVGEDVTALQTTRKALEDEKERMDVILSSLNTGLALINADMTVAWVNSKTLEILPWDELVGKVCYEAAAKRSEPCEGCGALCAFADGKIHETERQSPVDGKWHHIVSLPIRDDNGKVIQVLEATTDITGRKEDERVDEQNQN